MQMSIYWWRTPITQTSPMNWYSWSHKSDERSRKVLRKVLIVVISRNVHGVKITSIYHHCSNRTVDPIQLKKFNFGVCVNPTVRKSAPLIISPSESNLAEEPARSSRHHEAKQNRQSHGKMSLLSAPGRVLIKTTLMKSLAQASWCTQTMLLSKQVRLQTTVAGRWRDTQTIKVPGVYTLLR